MTRETERCQGEFLWKCSLNSISMKRQLTHRCRLHLHEGECGTPHPESVKVYKLSRILSLATERPYLRHKGFLLYFNVIMLSPKVENVSQGKIKKEVYGRNISNIK